MKAEEAEKTRQYWGQRVKLTYRAIRRLYDYEGILQPFNQGRIELKTDDGFIHSYSLPHVFAIIPLTQSSLCVEKKVDP